MFDKKNDYPVVLVPGMIGSFVPSTKRTIESLDIKCFTPSFCLLSGAWNRACELYAQIKGGVVDYGAAHSETFGTERYGSTYEGFYPEWGEVDKEGNVKKITIIAHGYGAIVARLLAHLMKNGSRSEREFTKTGLSPLFEGDNDGKIHCIVTLAGFNDGTSLFQAMDGMIPGSVKKLTKAAFILDAKNPCSYGKALKFQLPKDLKKPEHLIKLDKKIIEKYNRQLGDNIFHTAGLESMADFNKTVENSPSTYYIAYTGEVTKNYMEYLPDKSLFVEKNPLKMGKHENPLTLKKTYSVTPKKDVTLPKKEAGITAFTAALMGRYSNYIKGKPLVDEAAHPNDGIVNTNASLIPSTEEMIYFSNPYDCKKGEWVQMPIERKHHFEYIGFMVSPDKYYNSVFDLMKIICNLED